LAADRDGARRRDTLPSITIKGTARPEAPDEIDIL
jgi:hypothetical protein